MMERRCAAPSETGTLQTNGASERSEPPGETELKIDASAPRGRVPEWVLDGFCTICWCSQVS